LLSALVWSEAPGAVSSQTQGLATSLNWISASLKLAPTPMPEFEPQVAPEHYADPQYVTKERYICYWHQIDEVRRLAPSSVLDVGVGSGFLVHRLRELGMSVRSADADSRLQPDVVAVLPELPFTNGEFDVACCFEVLEHLPFEQFDSCVAELKRVAAKWVLLSLPDVTPYSRFVFDWGFKHTVWRWFFDFKRRRLPPHTFNGEHYWEVGKQGTPLELVMERLRQAGFADVTTFRVEEDPWHRFFRCRIA
jgi:SAM-dependent methyltransferase